MSRRKTKSQHSRDATLRPHRHGTGGLPVELPDMPQDMPAGVQAIWKTVSGQLDRAGIVAEVDGIELRRLCELCWIATEAFDDIQEKGITCEQTNKAGYTNRIPNPSLRMYFAAVKDITSIAHKFGMTPTGRLGMSFDEPADDDADELISFKVA